MPDYLRPSTGTSMTPYTAADDEMLAGDKRNNLPDTLSGLSVLPDGSWHEVNRPLADTYGVPGRGVEGHGADSDVKTVEYEPNQHGDAQFNDSDADTWADIVPPHPLFVTVVPNPLKSVTKKSVTRTVVDGTVAYTGAPFVGVDPANVAQISRDESRVKLTLVVGGNFSVATGNQSLKYAFAVSHETAFPFTNFILIDPVVGAYYEFYGTEPLYIGVWPLLAQDPTKQNSVVLNAVIETAGMVDYNPSV
jgi:hypothetical protein